LQAALSSGRRCDAAAGSDDIMLASESTCWTVIRAAAAGSPSGHDEPARRYLGAVHAYLSARGDDETAYGWDSVAGEVSGMQPEFSFHG
jgi:hypothetical protein